MAENKRESIDQERAVEELTVKVGVDVSEAITGLKAIQREAKEATKALRELEAETGKTTTVYDLQVQSVREELSRRRGDRCADEALALIDELRQEIVELEQGRNLSGVPTVQLANELAKREGVTEHIIGAHGDLAHLNIDKVDNGYNETITGPARIIVNQD